MADTPQGRRLTELFRQLQIRIARDTARQLDTLWRLLNSDGLLTEAEWIDAVMMVLGRNHEVSVVVARRYYRGYRAAELRARGAVDVFKAAPFKTDQARAALLANLGKLRELVGRGVDPFEAGRRVGLETSREAVEYVLDGARESIMNTVQVDDQAVGWYRVTDGDPCAFCALMASRGVAYKSQSSASFGAHPSCGCTAKPAFSVSKFGDVRSKQWNDLYRSSTRGHRDKLNAFRRAYERPHIPS